MKLDSPFLGVNFQLRSVNESDTQEILRLRLDSSLNAYLNLTTPQGHSEWLKEQIQKENDYYFAIEEIGSSKLQGFIGIYDIQAGSGEWGRWILEPNSVAAIESYWLILKFGFELRLDTIYCRTDVRNVKVIAIHDRLPFTKTNLAEDDFSGLTYKVHYLDQLLL